jgi:hypothetical protein
MHVLHRFQNVDTLEVLLVVLDSVLVHDVRWGRLRSENPGYAPLLCCRYLM